MFQDGDLDGLADQGSSRWWLHLRHFENSERPHPSKDPMLMTYPDDEDFKGSAGGKRECLGRRIKQCLPGEEETQTWTGRNGSGTGPAKAASAGTGLPQCGQQTNLWSWSSLGPPALMGDGIPGHAWISAGLVNLSINREMTWEGFDLCPLRKLFRALSRAWRTTSSTPRLPLPVTSTAGSDGEDFLICSSTHSLSHTPGPVVFTGDKG